MTGGRIRRVLVTTGSFLPGFKGGGPVQSIVEVLGRLPEDVVALVVTADRDFGDTAPYPLISGRIVPYGRHRVLYANPKNPRHQLKSFRILRAQQFDLAYFNSFWSPWFTMAPVLAILAHLIRVRRVLLVPRGELYSGALAIKSRKKRLTLRVWAPILRAANPVFQVSSEQEAVAVEAAVPWAKTIIQVNSKGRQPLQRPISPGPVPRFVFLSRISPKKNLLLAIRAVGALSTPAVFDIYGPVEDSAYWGICEREILRHKGPAKITYRGALPHERVHETLAQYDALVFPTHGENFGHVILESLSVGCAVVTSPFTPWSVILQQGAGTVVEGVEAGAWTCALETMAARSAAERLQSKLAVLAAYRKWREGVDDTLAVVAVLESAED